MPPTCTTWSPSFPLPQTREMLSPLQLFWLPVTGAAIFAVKEFPKLQEKFAPKKK